MKGAGDGFMAAPLAAIPNRRRSHYHGGNANQGNGCMTESTEAPQDAGQPPPQRGLRWPQVVLIVLATVAVTAGATWWFLNSYLFAKAFQPVTLDAREEQVLDDKLRRLGFDPAIRSREENKALASDFDAQGRLKPEPYSEEGASREVVLSERELNALLASNPEMARKLAFDLSDDMISLRLLVPVDPDFPVFGGKTLRVRAGMEIAYRDGRPVVVLKGVSVMGVPLPNAWLGNLKNIDLVHEFGDRQGFWKAFADGVDQLRVEDGRLLVKLKE